MSGLPITRALFALGLAVGLVAASPPASLAAAPPDAAPVTPNGPDDPPPPPGVAPPAATVASPAETERTQDPGAEARPWAVIVQGGFSVLLLEDTPLGRQLLAADYGADAIGPSFTLVVQRYVLDWLVVGGGLDLRYYASETAENDSFSGSLKPNETSELWRVGASIYVQPTLCLEYGSCKREGTFFGLQLGSAFGPTFWVLRDEADVGWHVRLEAALLWQVGFGDVLLGFRLHHAIVWQSGMGPRDLGTPFTWVPTPELQLGYRW